MDGMGLGQQKGPMSHSGYEVTTTDVDSEIAKRNVKMVGRSDAGTNLKVGGGQTSGTISRFGECIRDAQYSFVSFLLAVLLLTVPSWPECVKVGRGHVPLPVLYGIVADACSLFNELLLSQEI